MKNTEENIKKFHETINSKCPVCNQLLNIDRDIFKSNDVGFHKACAENTDKEHIEDLIDEVLDDTYGVKAETIMEGERDIVLNRYDYGDEIVYRVEYWNNTRTGFDFGTEYSSFEDAYKKFKSMQYENK